MSSVAGSLGWTCTLCTFRHHAPADRCSMCNQLRVTQKHMHDFVNGVPIPKECRVDPLFSRAAAVNAPGSHHERDSENRPPASSQRAKVITNPYFTKLKTQSNPKEQNQLGPDPPRVEKRPPISAQHSTILRESEPTTKCQSMEEQRQNSSKNREICSIFQPRTNLLRPPQQQQQRPFTPGPVPLDLAFSKEWIFPVDEKYPKRDYQLEISEAAILENTLVSLPTGLGKTLIAAVVMYNFYRFFPRGKILFLAPTLPLVNQQVQACFNIMGIPETDTAVLTGKINASRRAQLWKDKRVFYCTPQTIQFDLEASRCNPDHFVCVVLDEAHRATGNHSYVTIVNRLFESNAKFRLLGLSATPGKTIKDIQAVIDVLRISKIEARTEDDSSIAKYIHDRAVEEVMVPNVSVAKDVERMLNDLLLVQLDTLRSRGAMSGALDYQYITSHQLRKIQERLPDNSLSGIFHIATTICDLRTKVHVNGLACVHSVMKRLLSTRHMGPMAGFLRSEGFLKVWEVVENGKDKAANNPKLVKLREILTEHFERDRAIGRSSRTIVFSQFRDSVSEIVSTLQACSPLIRPRHFIGQGNRTKGSEGQLQGMNQAEQQEVIRQFRSDVYNVLVCTSIGEEGLDIGEVDLIVNYDVVRSAIRSIQRIGRTGRKRDGRVVVLVSEGQEKKSYDSSKHSVGTLARALKSNKFKVNLGEPLFPTKPILREKKMAVAGSFRSSQVEGHEGAKKRGRDPKNSDDKTSEEVSSEWKLSESEMEYTSQITPTFFMSDYLKSEKLPRDLSRRFVSGRVLAFARNDPRLDTRGRSSSILDRVERTPYCIEDSCRLQSNLLPSNCMLPSDFRNRCFPLRHSLEAEVEVSFDKPLEIVRRSAVLVSATDGKDNEREESRPASTTCTKRPKIMTCNLYQGASKISESKQSSESTLLNSSVRDTACKHDLSQPSAPKRLVKRNPYASLSKGGPSIPFSNSSAVDQQTFQASCELESSESNRTKEQDSSGNSFERTSPHMTTRDRVIEQNLYGDPTLKTCSLGGECISLQTRTGNREIESIPDGDFTNKYPAENVTNECSSWPTLTESRVGQNPTRDAIEPVDALDRSPNPATNNPELDDEFVLPSQSDCSSSSDDDSDKGDVAMKMPSPSTEEFEFRLPSPASSCSSDEGAETPKQSGYPCAQKTLFCGTALHTNELSLTENLQTLDTPDEDVIFRRGNRSRKIRAIVDATQYADDASVHVDQPRESPKGLKTLRDLTNTQETPTPTTKSPTDEIVCAICLSGDSPDEDPIVLCDGPGRGKVCDLAVHTTCYSISANFRDSDEWRCDPCDFRYKGLDKEPITCLSCGNSNGALKRVDGSIFHHIECNQPNQPETHALLHRTKGKDHIIAAEGKGKKNDALHQSKMLRRAAVRKFFDEEADIDSDEDMDGDLSENDDIEAIEDEEANISGFINDTSQLGYTQDELDRIDPDANLTTIHQELDNMRVRAQQFNTPILNRRMRDAKGRDSLGSPDSANGLGNMHFIRSVLEHHRQGGGADEIEEHYNQLEAEASPVNEDAFEIPVPPTRQVVYYESSDSDED